MTAPTVRAYNGRVLITMPETTLDAALTALAQDMCRSAAVESALSELASALGWLHCPPHSDEPGVLDPAAYERRRDAAMETLRAVVGLVVLSLPPGAARDFGRDLEHESASILARSTQDLLHTLEARRG